MPKKFSILIVLLLAFGAAPLLAQTFEIDRGHSSVGFSIRHIVSKVKGRFTAFSGTIVYDSSKIENSSVSVTIDAASINTDNEKRDGHLKSADFFEVEKYPQITFRSIKVFKQKDLLMLTGLLNMHGVEKEITFPFEVLGILKSGSGKMSGGFEAELKLDRTNFNIAWNRPLELGGVLLGDEVTIDLNIEAREAEKEAEQK
ncbi:MAG: YceI family protein [candidate division Zixibacteria bacterium]|nr:YceI family protein [candidate division Zixibacteria bacterium]